MSRIRSRSRVAVALTSLGLLAGSGAAFAQAAPPSFQASPEIYKLLTENAQFRVVEVTWKPGQRDKMHGHPASAVYLLTDCALRNFLPDGSTRDNSPRAGMAFTQAPIPGHEVQNIGSSDCRLVMVELK